MPSVCFAYIKWTQIYHVPLSSYGKNYNNEDCPKEMKIGHYITYDVKFEKKIVHLDTFPTSISIFQALCGHFIAVTSTSTNSPTHTTLLRMRFPRFRANRKRYTSEIYFDFNSCVVQKR